MKKLYFSHDFNAHTDPKIERLIFNEGWQAYGLYWAIVEKLAQAGGKLHLNYKCISFVLHTKPDFIKKIVEDYELFIIQDGFFWSERLLNHFQKVKSITEKRKLAVSKRWQKHENNDTSENPENTNVLQMNYKCITNDVTNENTKVLQFNRKENKNIKEKVKEKVKKENEKEINTFVSQKRSLWTISKAKKIPLPNTLANSQKFVSLWHDWLKHLQEKKKLPKHTTVNFQLKKLEKIGLDRAIRALEHSIANNYQGIFEPKNQNDDFIPPTAQQVADYLNKRYNTGILSWGVNNSHWKSAAEYFVNYYTARNWAFPSGDKIKDWKAVVRTWERNSFYKVET